MFHLYLYFQERLGMMIPNVCYCFTVSDVESDESVQVESETGRILVV